jgi:hypothetical protein
MKAAFVAGGLFCRLILLIFVLVSPALPEISTQDMFSLRPEV